MSEKIKTGRFVILTVGVILTMLSSSEAHCWRTSYHRKIHKPARVSPREDFATCQTACANRFGVDGRYCRELDFDAKKKCREESRNCLKDCWNAHRARQ